MEKYVEFFRSLEKILFQMYKNPEKNVRCPASLDEIEALENKLNVKFPMALKGWLLVYGHSAMRIDLFFTLRGIEEAFQEAKENNLKEEIQNYCPNFNDSYICVEYYLGSDTYCLMSSEGENPLIHCYAGFDSLSKVGDFLECIRDTLLTTLCYLKNHSEKLSDRLLTEFPFLDIYKPVRTDDSIFQSRLKFYTIFSTIDSNGKILGFEEVEMAFRDYYLGVKDLDS